MEASTPKRYIQMSNCLKSCCNSANGQPKYVCATHPKEVASFHRRKNKDAWYRSISIDKPLW